MSLMRFRETYESCEMDVALPDAVSLEVREPIIGQMRIRGNRVPK